MRARRSPRKPRGWRETMWGQRNFHHVLNLFVLYRFEREHPKRPVPTDRYRAWLAKRDGHVA